MVPAEPICFPPSAQPIRHVSHFPVLFPHHPCFLSGLLHLISSATFAAGRETQLLFLGALAGRVWWLLAVMCTRCINKAGKKTSNIFSLSLLCATRKCSMWRGNAVIGLNMPFFSLVSSPFFLSHSGLCIPLSHSSCVNSTEHWWALNSI